MLSQLIALHAAAQQYTFHEDGEKEGLNSLTVNCLLQDHTGFLWVCTENGLYRFDGATYTRISPAQGLLDSFIVSIHEDANGELWVGSTNNIYHGDGKHFSAISSGGEALTGSPGQQLDSPEPGRVLAVSQHRLFQLTHASAGGEWTSAPFFSAATLNAYPQLNDITSVYATRSGSVWVGCSDSICQVSGQNVKVWGAMDGVPADTWSWFLEDSAGRLWARGYHHVLQRGSQGAAFANEEIRSAPVSFNSTFLTMVEDTDHRIVTRTDRGLAIWSDGKWRTLDAENGLTLPSILALLVDHDGGLWLGTYGKGVQRWLGYRNWETWGATQGLAQNPVWTLARDQRGVLWAATESGIARLEPQQTSFTFWHPNSNTPRGQVVSVMEAHDHSLWFATTAGLILRYAQDSGRTQQWRVPSSMRRIWMDSTNRVWAMTGDGVYAIDKSLGEFKKIQDPAVPERLFSDACEDAGHGLWFASKAGIFHLSEGRWSRIALRGKAATDGFASVVCAADGTLWLGGASTGVEHLRIEGNEAVDAEPRPPAQLDAVETMFVRRDHRGWLWIGSGSGVFVFNGAAWRHVTELDGLTWDDCNEGAFLDDKDGSVWIGTSNGLSHLLNPERLFEPQTLRIISVDAALGDAAIPVNSSASFAWTRQPLRVHVVSSALGDQASIVYRYRLVGLEEEWASSRSQDLHYTSLPDGEYRLEVYAEDANRGVRSPLTVIAFQMRPPWWRSTAFEILLAVLLLTLGYAILRFRERHLTARQAELESLVRARTSELELEKVQLVEAREALHFQAIRDSLTGLLNHAAIRDSLKREMDRARRDASPLTVVMIDVDNFKLINDTEGHMAGDTVLREVGHRLTGSIRPYDAVGRYGGDEFLLVMPNFDANGDRARLTLIHRTICGEPIAISKGGVDITCSFGVSILSGEYSSTVEQLLVHADRALYDAKNAGRNCIIYHEPS